MLTGVGQLSEGNVCSVILGSALRRIIGDSEFCRQAEATEVTAKAHLRPNRTEEEAPHEWSISKQTSFANLSTCLEIQLNLQRISTEETIHCMKCGLLSFGPTAIIISWPCINWDERLA